MKITIQNTDYEVTFGFAYMKFYMKKYKLISFVAFEEHSAKRFSFSGDIGIGEFEVIAKFVYESFTWHLDSKPTLTLEDFYEFLFDNLYLIQEVNKYYVQCLPKKGKSEPIPITEGN